MGFPHIYESYRELVVPIEHTNSKGDISLGTGFFFDNGIITAKHCLEGAKTISIKGVTADELRSSLFFVHEKPLLDVVYIQLPNKPTKAIELYDDCSILDEVMTLGYPKVSGYHNFLASEKASIAARFTASIGQVSSIASDIWMKERLLLITARITKGNSGGPVINKYGSVIGISVNMPLSEGDYDDLGYGICIPFSLVKKEIIESSSKVDLPIDALDFNDFPND